jgi:5'-AMP-activated protein kinase regulatory beta subunit
MWYCPKSYPEGVEMKKRHAGKSVKRRRIIFSYDDSQARAVAVLGDFNNWHESSHRMKRDEKGRWQKIMILPPGDYEYKFIVDGQWQTDPHNPHKCANSFGSFNNILRVRAKKS